MADYFTKFSFRVELPSKAAQAYALDLAAKAREYLLDRDEPPPPDFPASLLAGFETLEDVGWGFTIEQSSEGNAIWVHDEYFLHQEVDVVSLFVQHLLQRFNPAGCVKFAWSADCTKPRSDAYGGGAVFITAQEIRIMTTGQWLAEQHV